jgi:hypothetical protein
MGHNLIIIVVRNLFFISLYGIDTYVIHLLVLFEHRCCVHYLDTNVICLFVLFRHKCCVSIRIVYTRKLCTRFLCLNNAWHLCVNNTNPWNNKFHMDFEWPNDVTTPLWAKCEGEAHTPKSGKLESFGTPKNSERKFRGQISLHLCTLGVIEKVLKCGYPKWPRMSQLDICSPSYGQKKGRESKWQFDSRPLKVGNWPVPDVHSESATWRWKALFEGYNFGLDLVPIGGRGEELWSPKVLGLQPETVLGLHFGSPGKKSHSDATPMGKHRVYYREYGGGISRVRAVVCLVSSI